MYELTMSLNPKSKTPLYEQIYEFIKEEIQNNVIQSGERLPSTRALSKHLVVSRSTVELAYEQLLSEGYVEAIPCKGYFVAKIEGIYQLQKRPEIKVEPISSGVTEYAYDFTPNGVDLNSFPYNIWRKLSKECLIDGRDVPIGQSSRGIWASECNQQLFASGKRNTLSSGSDHYWSRK